MVHDARGNAVWDWLATTSRLAVEATSRLLRKLEMPELKIEDTKDEELRIAPEPGSGAGYDPYNQAVKPPSCWSASSEIAMTANTGTPACAKTACSASAKPPSRV